MRLNMWRTLRSTRMGSALLSPLGVALAGLSLAACAPSPEPRETPAATPASNEAARPEPAPATVPAAYESCADCHLNTVLSYLEHGMSESIAPIEVAEIAFTGDTTSDVLDREPDLMTVRRLLVETTFVGDHPDVAAARSRGHLHLDEILERAHRFRNQHLLLVHISTRHSPEDVAAQLERFPASTVPKVRALI